MNAGMTSQDQIGQLLRRAASARGAEYAALVEQAIRGYELEFETSPANGFRASATLGLLAEKRSPAQVTRLRRKVLEWMTRFPAVRGKEGMETSWRAEAYAQLARFQTGERADALFRQAEQSLLSIAPGSSELLLIDQCADVLCQWVDQERNPESDAIFERACQKLEEGHRLDVAHKRKRLLRFARRAAETSRGHFRRQSLGDVGRRESRRGGIAFRQSKRL